MQKNTTATTPLTESWFNSQNTFFHDKQSGVNHLETGVFSVLLMTTCHLPLTTIFAPCKF